MSNTYQPPKNEHTAGDQVTGIIKYIGPNGTMMAEIGGKSDIYYAIIEQKDIDTTKIDPYRPIIAGSAFDAIVQTTEGPRNLSLHQVKPLYADMSMLDKWKYAIKKKLTFYQRNRPAIPTHIYDRAPAIGDTIIARIRSTLPNGTGNGECLSYIQPINVYYDTMDACHSKIDPYTPIVPGIYITGIIRTYNESDGCARIDNVTPIYSKHINAWWKKLRRLGPVPRYHREQVLIERK